MLEEIAEDCGSGGGGGGGNPPPNRLWLDTLRVRAVCVNNNCAEGNEREVSSVNSSRAPGTLIRCTSVPSTGSIDVRNWYCTGSTVHETSPTEASWVDVWVDETDGWPNPDDHFRRPDPNAQGLPIAWRVRDNGGGTLWAHFWHWVGGNWECGSVAGFPACDPQVSLKLHWS